MEVNETKVICDNQTINPDSFWGGKQRIIEVIGEGSGAGFSLKHANLPMDWEKSLDRVREIQIERFSKYIISSCAMYGYKTDEICFDSNNILKKLVIADNPGEVSTLSLGGDFRQVGKAEYSTRNLSKIGAAVLLQSVLSHYLSIGWSNENFRYGYIGKRDDYIGAYYPRELEIPKSVDLSQQVTNEYFQEGFKLRANNIAGRFGLDLNNIEFNEKGVLTSVEVNGTNGCYYNLRSETSHRYICHNVDTANQAAALHGITASYINFLIDNNERN